MLSPRSVVRRTKNVCPVSGSPIGELVNAIEVSVLALARDVASLI